MRRSARLKLDIDTRQGFTNARSHVEIGRDPGRERLSGFEEQSVSQPDAPAAVCRARGTGAYVPPPPDSRPRQRLRHQPGRPTCHGPMPGDRATSRILDGDPVAADRLSEARPCRAARRRRRSCGCRHAQESGAVPRGPTALPADTSLLQAERGPSRSPPPASSPPAAEVLRMVPVIVTSQPSPSCRAVGRSSDVVGRAWRTSSPVSSRLSQIVPPLQQRQHRNTGMGSFARAPPGGQTRPEPPGNAPASAGYSTSNA